jgi:hypothetical protein
VHVPHRAGEPGRGEQRELHVGLGREARDRSGDLEEQHVAVLDQPEEAARQVVLQREQELPGGVVVERVEVDRRARRAERARDVRLGDQHLDPAVHGEAEHVAIQEAALVGEQREGPGTVAPGREAGPEAERVDVARLETGHGHPMTGVELHARRLPGAQPDDGAVVDERGAGEVVQSRSEEHRPLGGGGHRKERDEQRSRNR